MSEHIPVLANLNNRYDIAWFGNTVNAQMKSNSYVWFSQMTSDIMHKPEKYSKTSIKKIEEKYHLKSEEINKYRNQFINEQTVIDGKHIECRIIYFVKLVAFFQMVIHPFDKIP